MHKFTMSFDDAVKIHELVSRQVDTYKNLLVGAVEDENFEEAKNLVNEIQDLERHFALFNMKAKQSIAIANKTELNTEHRIKPKFR